MLECALLSFAGQIVLSFDHLMPNTRVSAVPGRLAYLLIIVIVTAGPKRATVLSVLGLPPAVR